MIDKRYYPGPRPTFTSPPVQASHRNCKYSPLHRIDCLCLCLDLKRPRYCPNRLSLKLPRLKFGDSNTSASAPLLTAITPSRSDITVAMGVRPLPFFGRLSTPATALLVGVSEEETASGTACLKWRLHHLTRVTMGKGLACFRTPNINRPA